jgi:hypothetical protein
VLDARHVCFYNQWVLKQTDLKQKHDKTITEVTLGGLRKDEELKQKVKDKQSRLVGKLMIQTFF